MQSGLFMHVLYQILSCPCDIYFTEIVINANKRIEKSTRRRRKHCALAVVRRSQKFSPRRRPPSRGREKGKISWRWSLHLLTNPVWWGSMHAISSCRGNRPTNKQTNTETHTQTDKHTTPARRPLHTGPITIHCATKLSTQCNDPCYSKIYSLALWYRLTGLH